MSSKGSALRLALALVIGLAGTGLAQAERPPDLSQTVSPHPLPAPVTTAQSLSLPGRTLQFKATAGAIRISDSQTGTPIAEIGVTSFALNGIDPAKRPVVFAINGGPGSASAWLDVGAIGPWRLPVEAADISPAALPRVVDNADTWLDFADLVFIDPVGTGYSRMLGRNDDAEKQFYSVDGDIGEIATVIRKWLVENNRLSSPKFIVGESYGGFRAPKLVKKLRDADNIGINGIVMISPVLDFGWFTNESNPAVSAAMLPSLVAAAKGLKGPNPRAKLGAVESYAAGPYLVDLFKGVRDFDAIRRMSVTLAGFTGLDEAFVQRLGGRIDASVLTREKNRAASRIASAYDSTVTGYDPAPFDYTTSFSDPVLDGLKAPFATAMADITINRLKWPVDSTYEILNMQVIAHWDWDIGHRHLPQSLGELSDALALDPHFHALVMHGVTDQVTPYFTSKMLIDQIPAYGDPSRLRLAVYGGGHMPYLDDVARAAMREDARQLIVGRDR